MNAAQQSSTSVLCWPKRLLSADDLRRHLTSQRELVLLPGAIVTPLAADELKAREVRIRWQAPAAKEATAKQGTWSYAQEQPDALIASAVQALRHDGIILAALDVPGMSTSWARSVAESIGGATSLGCVVFCAEPALVSCVANKIAGVRAALVFNVPQVLRAQKHLAPNLFAVEMPGRTFFELRHMLKTIVSGSASCPDEIANTLKELDGHAHR
jgi:ribose 5-phosphate isomerase RpiB